MAQKQKILINAIHSKSGGGLAYLCGILPHLAKNHDVEWHLLIPPTVSKSIEIPSNVILHEKSPPSNFILCHLWEQTILPILCYHWRVESVFCNANYAPLLAPKPSVIIHNNPTVGAYAKTFTQKTYWCVLLLLTRLSLLRCKHSFSVANHIVPTICSGIWSRLQGRVTTAHPACNAAPSGQKRNQQEILAVGDIYIQKNYSILIEAFAEVLRTNKQAKLTIIGRPIDTAETDHIKTLIANLNLKKSVILQGFTPHKQLMQQLSKCTVYANTSLVECFNMPVLEALTCGAPTVLLDTPFQKEVAGSAAIYTKNDVKDFSAALSDLLNDEDKRAKLSELGKKQAQQFSWHKTAQLIYEKIKLHQ